MRIVFAGSIAYDYLMTFPGYFKDHILPEKLESLSLSFLTDSMARHRGGTAPNIAYNYALLGGKGMVLGTGGEDFSEYRSWLDSAGIDTAGIVEIPDEFTASFFANTDRSNAQIASFYPGAMAHSSQLQLADLAFKPDLVVVSPDDPEAMRARVTECQRLDIPYFYDPSQQIVRLDLEDLYAGITGAHMVVVNEYEFGLINDKLGLDEDEIMDYVTILGITRGEHGATMLSQESRYDVPSVTPDELQDPTGVGDAFRGGLLRGIALELSLEVCSLMGALAATYCLEHVGSQNHHYTRPSFAARFRTHFDDDGALDAIL